MVVTFEEQELINEQGGKKVNNDTPKEGTKKAKGEEVDGQLSLEHMGHAL